jgi:hypothetical protein
MAAITARNDGLGGTVSEGAPDEASSAGGGETSMGMHGNLNWRPAATMAWPHEMVGCVAHWRREYKRRQEYTPLNKAPSTSEHTINWHTHLVDDKARKAAQKQLGPKGERLLDGSRKFVENDQLRHWRGQQLDGDK